MGVVDLQLRALRPGDEVAVREAHAELLADGFEFLLRWDSARPWVDHLEKIEGYRQGINLPDRWVASTFLGAFVDGELVGRIDVRHELNDFLTNFGGHIGYCVRPGHRRRGYATEILRQGLAVARDEGAERVLVTCDEHNAPSARVIERNGGVLDDVRERPDGPARRRYWIET